MPLTEVPFSPKSQSVGLRTITHFFFLLTQSALEKIKWKNWNGLLCATNGPLKLLTSSFIEIGISLCLYACVNTCVLWVEYLDWEYENHIYELHLSYKKGLFLLLRDLSFTRVSFIEGETLFSTVLYTGIIYTLCYTASAIGDEWKEKRSVVHYTVAFRFPGPFFFLLHFFSFTLLRRTLFFPP